ncbi:MAG: CPBP family intramembrane metalloprotease [Cyclobacteriaceae bacterium]|nr:CPBP family intramembrane metalloprotease [Cyclobacteriaceae bacterium]
MLRPAWQNIFRFNWLFGLLLILLLGIPRFILVLQANVTGNYNFIPVIFILMMIAPVVFLTKEGRRTIGIKKPANYHWLLYSFLAGIAACAVMFLTAELLFNETISNWFVYISKSYAVSQTGLTESDRLIFFVIYSIIGMTFSPIGEEVFYRGIVHGSFAVQYGNQKASVIDSLAFALTHLAHFGIIYISGRWSFLLLPSLLWVFFMFMASRLFFVCKQKTGSILGAVVSHAGYNLAMMYFIFYHIL